MLVISNSGNLPCVNSSVCHFANSLRHYTAVSVCINRTICVDFTYSNYYPVNVSTLLSEASLIPDRRARSIPDIAHSDCYTLYKNTTPNQWMRKLPLVEIGFAQFNLHAAIFNTFCNNSYSRRRCQGWNVCACTTKRISFWQFICRGKCCTLRTQWQ